MKKIVTYFELVYGGFILGFAIASIWAGLHGYKTSSANEGIAYIGLLVWFVLYREYRKMTERAHKLNDTLFDMLDDATKI